MKALDQMKVLDLYCGAGGAARGLMQAGFHVVGVDILSQPRYPGDAFIQADALDYLAQADLSAFDLIWASPPCQRYTSLRHAPGEHRDADLIAPTREALKRCGLPCVIENVEGAPLVNPVLLCGSMFGLRTPGGLELRRHRLFQANFLILAPECAHGPGPVVGVYGGHFRDRRRAAGTNHRGGSNVPNEHGFIAMGIPPGSMTAAELSDAVPPSYSRFIAERFLTLQTSRQLKEEATARARIFSASGAARGRTPNLASPEQGRTTIS
jgi:DNA (cytosine-5)-methyltransferase 1